MANNHFKMYAFVKRESLVDTLKQNIVNSLQNAILEKGFASLALSGGSTPLKFLQELSKVVFEWEKVRVTLVDERLVDVNSEKSNEKLIRDNLLMNEAKKAQFFGLKSIGENLEKLIYELDVVVLGMGLDGHTASFFSDDEALENALSTNSLVCATTASSEPKECITLSRTYLLSAKHLFLHIEGKEKYEVFLEASKSDNVSSMPIIAMMQQTKPLLEVYYAD